MAGRQQLRQMISSIAEHMNRLVVITSDLDDDLIYYKLVLAYCEVYNEPKDFICRATWNSYVVRRQLLAEIKYPSKMKRRMEKIVRRVVTDVPVHHLFLDRNRLNIEFFMMLKRVIDAERITQDLMHSAQVARLDRLNDLRDRLLMQKRELEKHAKEMETKTTPSQKAAFEIVVYDYTPDVMIEGFFCIRYPSRHYQPFPYSEKRGPLLVNKYWPLFSKDHLSNPDIQRWIDYELAMFMLHWHKPVPVFGADSRITGVSFEPQRRIRKPSFISGHTRFVTTAISLMEPDVIVIPKRNSKHCLLESSTIVSQPDHLFDVQLPPGCFKSDSSTSFTFQPINEDEDGDVYLPAIDDSNIQPPGCSSTVLEDVEMESVSGDEPMSLVTVKLMIDPAIIDAKDLTEDFMDQLLDQSGVIKIKGIQIEEVEVSDCESRRVHSEEKSPPPQPPKLSFQSRPSTSRRPLTPPPPPPPTPNDFDPNIELFEMPIEHLEKYRLLKDIVRQQRLLMDMNHTNEPKSSNNLYSAPYHLSDRQVMSNIIRRLEYAFKMVEDHFTSLLK